MRFSRNTQDWLSRGAFYFLVFLIVLGCVGPFAWQIITSIKPARELTTLPPLLPSQVTVEHYIRVFERPFGKYIMNSVIVASATTVFCLVVGSFAAYALGRLRMKGKMIILSMVLAVSMFPEIAIVSPLYIVMRNLRLLNTYPALILPYTTFAMPLTLWILTSFFREIPAELEEAAKIDGCSPLQAFWKVILPIAAPGMFTTAILVFIAAWNEFLFALTFTKTIQAQTIPVGIAMLPTMYHVPWGSIAAASVIVTIPLIILVLVFQRRIISGLTAGAVKG